MKYLNKGTDQAVKMTGLIKEGRSFYGYHILGYYYIGRFLSKTLFILISVHMGPLFMCVEFSLSAGWIFFALIQFH